MFEEVHSPSLRDQEKYPKWSYTKPFLFFSWIAPLLQRGNSKVLEQVDIWKTAKDDHAKDRFLVLEGHVKSYTTGSEAWRLVKALLRAYRSSALWILLTNAITSIIFLIQPDMAKLTISYVASSEKQVPTGLVLFAVLLFLKFLQRLTDSHLMYHFSLFDYNCCNGLAMCVYSKALKYPNLCSKQYSLSQILSYSQVDAQRMNSISFDASTLVFFPVQLIVGIILLYRFIGLSFLAGIGVVIVMGLFTFLNSKLSSTASEQLLLSKDRRMKETSEVFNLIRFIKTNAWEDYFQNKLGQKRKEELKWTKRTGFYSVLSTFFFSATTPLISVATFALMLYQGEEITAEKAFTTIMIFNLIEFPIRIIPESIVELTRTWASLKRLGHFLYSEQIDNKYISYGSSDSEVAIHMNNATFYWELEKKDVQADATEDILSQEISSQAQISQQKISVLRELSEQPKGNMTEENKLTAIKNINLAIKRGELTVIIGDVGSGKSSLLYSMLGEMKPQGNPAININGSVAFVAQTSWVISGTIEDNILMMQSMEYQRFQQAIKYSCLDEDLKSLPRGEKTIIGERGINLSGGQKVRLNLARALYSNKDIYLMDDMLSSVDAHVSGFIMNSTVLGYLKGKTRVLITHATEQAKWADHIIVMQKGQIIEQGKYQQVRNTEYFKEISKSSDTRVKKAPIDIPARVNDQLTAFHQQNSSTKSSIISELLLPEDQQAGQVSLQPYNIYMKLNGGWPFASSLCLLMFGWIILTMYANIQIQQWCNDPANGKKHLSYYTTLALSASFLVFLRSLVLVFSAIRQGRIAHNSMIKSLVYASIPNFFDRVPTGRIINRLTKDLNELDQIGNAVGWGLADFFTFLRSVTMCVYASTPYILLPVGLFSIVCFRLKNFYMKSQRECTRLANVSASPVVSGITEVLNGLPIVRAYSLEKDFITKQTELMNVHRRNTLTKIALQAWFGQRLAWVSFIINFFAIAYCIFSGEQNGAKAGLLLTWASTLDEDVLIFVFAFTRLENRMISVERVSHFMEIQPELGYTVQPKSNYDDASTFISTGNIEFCNYSMAYREGLPFVLKDLNFTIKAGEKIGVVGRTGAGKSSLTSAILRLVQPTCGTILVDGNSITDVPLKSLRQNITLIPQQPVLFEGTLRQNLDPKNEHTDDVLLEALRKCCLGALTEQRQGIQTKISQSGSNLSIGQRQLICIARAVIRKCRIVLIDEATANVDMRVDRIIQEVIGQCLKEATVITIAHRLTAVDHWHRILVMDDGRASEYDTFEKLMQNGNIFRSLYHTFESSSEEHRDQRPQQST